MRGTGPDTGESLTDRRPSANHTTKRRAAEAARDSARASASRRPLGVQPKQSGTRTHPAHKP